ncbi:MAG: serine hydroxymethyltransferase [Candidatus Ryanbacteria bacterium RIFCSPHIGHO2_12_FULL_47_12b]|nr:MAG: serine hydroxymethyltransferase [Candidatus Ryanbacteria bacterium RIFCSPHIGHO2_12_FULL_47_12b]
MKDSAIKKLIAAEEKRQTGVINLIASENYVSRGVREALGSVLTNKYAEGYPGARYYGGNEIVDEIERLAQARALKLFGLSDSAWDVNVQPYSGTPANFAIYTALVPLGAKIMGLDLSMGGHLSHGYKVSATGKFWKQVPYGVDKKTERLDYNEILRIAKREKPKMIVAGFTAYSRIIDFKKFRKIADAVGAILLVDMSHFAGLVAGRVYPLPFPYADIVMTTTHKTLRGPRAAIIFSREKYARAIDRAVFPGLQGGPHVNQIASVAVALAEAATPAFRAYTKQIVKNAQILAGELSRLNWRVVSGGTDTHLFLVDTFANGIGGKRASEMLEKAGIIVNKNTIPFDTRSPVDPSGIRVGTAALTTRGMREREMKIIAGFINETLRGASPIKIRKNVLALARKFPLP